MESKLLTFEHVFWNFKFQVIVFVVGWLNTVIIVLYTKILNFRKTCAKVYNFGSKRFPKVWNDKKWCPFIFEDKNWLSYDRKCLFLVFNVQGREMRILIKIPLNVCAYILLTWGTKGLSFSFSHSLAGKIKWKIKNTSILAFFGFFEPFEKKRC